MWIRYLHQKLIFCIFFTSNKLVYSVDEELVLGLSSNLPLVDKDSRHKTEFQLLNNENKTSFLIPTSTILTTDEKRLHRLKNTTNNLFMSNLTNTNVFTQTPFEAHKQHTSEKFDSTKLSSTATSSTPYVKATVKQRPESLSSGLHKLGNVINSFSLMSKSTTAEPFLFTTSFEQRPRCQSLNSKELVSSAVTCSNKRSDHVCSLLFKAANPKTGTRDPRCNVAGLEDIADSCRQQCGICCEDINYACEDDDNQIIDCSKQLDKCSIAKWFDVLARFCAGTCGLCTKTDCRDYSIKCREQKHHCMDPAHIDYMRQHCSRTCGFCVVGPGGISESPLRRPPVPNCMDYGRNCTQHEALCASPMHAEYMIRYCAKTCFKCNSLQMTGDIQSQVIVPIISNADLQLNGTAAVLLPASVVMSAANQNQRCENHHPKCAIWVAKGFCTYSKYTATQKAALCPRACNMC